MITLKCIGQGSSGNCWVLNNNGELLILDAGLPIMQIKRGINYDIKSVVGVLITHSHKDHSLSADELKYMGLKVYKPYEKYQQLVKFGGYTIQCFPVPHGECDCFAFYIKFDGHRFLYATDFEYIPMNLKSVKLTDMLIECNYQNKYLNTDAVNLEHKVLGHCELETCKGIVEANFTDALQNVILTHIGVGTADAVEMSSEIKKLVTEDVSVLYGVSQSVYELKDNKCPF